MCKNGKKRLHMEILKGLIGLIEDCYLKKNLVNEFLTNYIMCLNLT